jgi:ATP/maltotriose-dependent transcriptional regulator MalT
MSLTDALARGRESYEKRRWRDAYDALCSADRESPLDPDDLDRLATAAYVTGRTAESAAIRARAHNGFLKKGDPHRAVRSAFWLGVGLFTHGERARAGAWTERCRQILHDLPECAEHGYLLLPAGYDSFLAGDLKASQAAFARAAAIGERFRDADLIALARHGLGRVLLRTGEIARGVAMLDEAMVAVETGEVSTLAVGDVYCSVIEGCLEVFDVRRAREWTAALTQWCESQPDLIPYSGQCLVRRAEILQLHGVWPEAVDEAQRACDRFLQGPDQPAAGAAFYQRAELHRLRGEFDAAEAAYRQASRYGRNPHPGLALLMFATGQVDDARTAIADAAADAKSDARRSKVLPALVEIALGAGDLPAARRAADELAGIAQRLDAPLAHAAAATARGAVLLGAGDAATARRMLRHAWTIWQEQEVPYEAARTRVLIGRACRALQDRSGAEMEIDAARWIFQQLGAAPALAGLEPAAAQAKEGGLSPRELQVLRLVAAGKSNREIARGLLISERTVERHVSNIFDKLDVSSRSAATAYAYEHRLI